MITAFKLRQILITFVLCLTIGMRTASMLGVDIPPLRARSIETISPSYKGGNHNVQPCVRYSVPVRMVCLQLLHVKSVP